MGTLNTDENRKVVAVTLEKYVELDRYQDIGFIGVAERVLKELDRVRAKHYRGPSTDGRIREI